MICFIVCIIYVVELQKSFKLICTSHLNSCFCFNTINKVEGPLERENVYSLVSWSFFVYIYIYYRAKSLSILSHLFFCTFAIFSYFLSSVSKYCLWAIGHQILTELDYCLPQRHQTMLWYTMLCCTHWFGCNWTMQSMMSTVKLCVVTALFGIFIETTNVKML